MADPNESHRDRRSPEDDTSAPESTRTPDIIDAEVVDDVREPSAPARPSGQPSPDDDEAFRQYQQFLEFQKFQEWQRQQGRPPGSMDGPAKAPWWKRILRLLRFKFVRRLLYLFLILLLIYAAINWYFGGSDSDQAENVGSQEERLTTHPIRQAAPDKAVRTIYDAVATEPGTVCEKFDPAARAVFAANNQAPTCAAAVQKVHAQLADPMLFKNPQFGENAVQIAGAEAVVRSCQTSVEGGPKLGDFKLRRDSTGWVIVDHANPPRC